MKKFIAYGIAMLVVLLVLTGCSCKHQWTEANCVEAKTCALCNITEGEPTGHNWVAASCTTSKTCTLCNEVVGEALGHSWVEADCENPKTCTVCALTEGEATGHSWSDWIRVETDACRSCTSCSAEDVITMTDYLITQLQGYWISTRDMFESDVAPNWFTSLEIRADGTAGVYTPYGVYPVCKLEYELPYHELNGTFYEELHGFVLTVENTENSFLFHYVPYEGFLLGYLEHVYEREPAETAALREMLQGTWTIDSFYVYDDALADVDHSGYTVEFHEGNKFTISAEEQLEGTWVHDPGGRSESGAVTYYAMAVTVGEDFRSMYFTLEVHNDTGEVLLRIERPGAERTAFVKNPETPV